jgi:hypothetical protein
VRGDLVACARAVPEHAALSALAPARVRVLFDQGTRHPLRVALTRHKVATAHERGWSTLENGDLPDAAEAGGFEFFVTTDPRVGRRFAG